MRAFSRTGIGLALAAAAVLQWAAPVHAQTFTVQGGTGLEGCTGATSFDITSAVPLQQSGSCNTGFAQSSGVARASHGALGIHAEGGAHNNDSRFATWSSAARFEDVLHFTSTDPLATTATVSVFLHLEGLLSINGPGGVANIDGSLTLNGVRSTFGFSPDATVPVSISGFTVLGVPATAAYGVPIDLQLQSFGVVVPLNQAVSFSLTLGNRIAVSGVDIKAESSFLNTFEVPTGTNAFALPDGVQVNAGSWLVNNQRVVVPAVPEPESWAMLVLGLGLVAAVLRKRAAIAA